MRKSRTPAGFVSKPLRNGSQKNAETFGTKNKEKGPKKGPKPFTRIAPISSRNKTAGPSEEDTHAKKQNPSRFCAQAIAKLQPEKSRKVAFGTH